MEIHNAGLYKNGVCVATAPVYAGRGVLKFSFEKGTEIHIRPLNYKNVKKILRKIKSKK